MDRLSPISTDSGFESCCCPSSPTTSSASAKFVRSTCVTSSPSSATVLQSATDVHNVICDLTPSSSEISLYREDSVSLDSVSTSSRNNDFCSSCAVCTSVEGPSSDSECINSENKSRYVDGGSIRYHCLWSGCENIFETADYLYDHVTEFHINVLRDLPCESSKAKQLEKDDDEPIKCHWDDCAMFLRRGDQQKKILWLIDHYRTRHARAANPFHCVIEGCQMRFSTTYKLEEHVRLEHINPPKPVKETPVVVKKESCYGWRPRVYYPVRPRPTLYCPHFDEKLLKCVRLMNKHNFDVAFTPVDFHADVKGAKRRKCRHRYAYRIEPSSAVPPKLARQEDVTTSTYDVESLRDVTIFDLFPPVKMVPIATNNSSTEPILPEVK
ncbi:Zinc finger C2H2 type [Trichostrongylus colubriformis]|uniref:Zinc finger C2H2 type n=1 Tax=Trichostrongylus colubriformis TaxID=6319 RepID=A0AAN8EUW0_TRICO